MRVSRAIAIVAALVLGCCGARGEEGRTDAAGDPLPEHAVMRLGSSRFRQPEFAVQVAFSGDGKRLVSIASDEGLRIWEVPSGKLIARRGHDRHGYELEGLACSADGKVIVAAGRASLQLLDASTGAVLRNVARRDFPCGLALSPDGGVLAATGIGGGVNAWNTTNGKALLDVKPYDLNARPSVAMSPDATRLWTFLRGNGARLWNLETGKEEPPPHAEMKDSAAGAYSADGRRLALADGKGVIRVYEADHDPVDLGSLAGGVVTLQFLQDGETLAAIGGAGVLSRWSVASRARQKDVALKAARALRDRGSSGYLPVIAISRDGRYVARPGVAIQLWDATTGELLSPTEGGTDTPSGLALSPDEQYVATGNEDGMVCLWSLVTGACVSHYVVEGEYAYPCPVGFTATGEGLIVTGERGCILLLSVPEMKLIRSYKDTGGQGIGLLDGGRMAVVGGVWRDGLALLDLRTGTVTLRPDGERLEGFSWVVVSPDESFAACAGMSHGGDTGFGVYEVRTGHIVFSQGGRGGDAYTSPPRFSPDSSYVIVEDYEGKVARWSTATGQRLTDEEAPELDFCPFLTPVRGIAPER